MEGVSEDRRETEAVTVCMGGGVGGARWPLGKPTGDGQTVNYVSSEAGRGKVGIGLEWGHVPGCFVSGLATEGWRWYQKWEESRG